MCAAAPGVRCLLFNWRLLGSCHLTGAHGSPKTAAINLVRNEQLALFGYLSCSRCSRTHTQATGTTPTVPARIRELHLPLASLQDSKTARERERERGAHLYRALLIFARNQGARSYPATILPIQNIVPAAPTESCLANMGLLLDVFVCGCSWSELAAEGPVCWPQVAKDLRCNAPPYS